MAYNDSGEIPASQSTYSLGGYTFELKVQNVHEPGEPDVVSVFAICRGPDGNRETQAVDYPEGTTVESWSVEANETEATVYALVVRKGMRYNAYPGDVIGHLQNSTFNRTFTRIGTGGSYATEVTIGGYTNILSISDTINGCPYHVFGIWPDGRTEYDVDIGANGWQDYEGKRYWYAIGGGIGQGKPSQYASVAEAVAAILPQIIGEGEPEQIMVGRFAIDLREADPEDWDEPPSTGEPIYTLNVYVTGASAGTHNSENIPLDGEIQSVYGSGGNGGNGGGGGAGASTVIIYEFTTDKAGSVNQEAYAREAGAGGPGGPGGRGADGCIIIFY